MPCPSPPANSLSRDGPHFSHLKVVLHFDGSNALIEKLHPLGVELCPESDERRFSVLLPEVEVLWHVLKPVTAEIIALAPKLKLIQKIGSGGDTIDNERPTRRGIPVVILP